MNVAPLDMTDRAAVAAWLVALHHHVTAASAIGFDVTAMEHHQLHLNRERTRLADTNKAITRLFAQVAPLLQEGGAFDTKRPPATAFARRREAQSRAMTAHLGPVKRVGLVLYLYPADLARVDKLISDPWGWGTRRAVLAAIFMYGLPVTEAEHIARLRWPGPDPSHTEERRLFENRFLKRWPRGAKKGGAK